MEFADGTCFQRAAGGNEQAGLSVLGYAVELKMNHRAVRARTDGKTTGLQCHADALGNPLHDERLNGVCKIGAVGHELSPPSDSGIFPRLPSLQKERGHRPGEVHGQFCVACRWPRARRAFAMCVAMPIS